MVFCRFVERRGPESVGSSLVVGGENGRNRFFVAARCASWDSGVLSPSGGTLLVPALDSEGGGTSRMEMDVSFGAPYCCLGVGITVCDNGGGINT